MTRVYKSVLPTQSFRVERHRKCCVKVPQRTRKTNTDYANAVRRPWAGKRIAAQQTRNNRLSRTAGNTRGVYERRDRVGDDVNTRSGAAVPTNEGWGDRTTRTNAEEEEDGERTMRNKRKPLKKSKRYVI